MNEEVKKALKELEMKASNILTTCECILDDILDVEESTDLFVIESAFEAIKRRAEEGYKMTQEVWDLFDEEEE